MCSSSQLGRIFHFILMRVKHHIIKVAHLYINTSPLGKPVWFTAAFQHQQLLPCCLLTSHRRKLHAHQHRNKHVFAVSRNPLLHFAWEGKGSVEKYFRHWELQICDFQYDQSAARILISTGARCLVGQAVSNCFACKTESQSGVRLPRDGQRLRERVCASAGKCLQSPTVARDRSCKSRHLLLVDTSLSLCLLSCGSVSKLVGQWGGSIQPVFW